MQGFLPRIAGLRVWTPAGSEFVKLLQEALGAKVRVEPRPAPVMPEEQCDVFPPDVAQAKHEHLARRRRNRLVMALAFIYLLGFAGWAGTLMWKEKKIDAGFAGIDRLKPQIEEVRTLQMRWHAMEPATDPDQYPAEIFNHIVSLLPPEGICLKEFRFELDKVVVSCEASTVAHAMKFQADLEGAEGLKRFNWPTQQPRILDDNRATFYAEGTLKPGGGGS